MLESTKNGKPRWPLMRGGCFLELITIEIQLGKFWYFGNIIEYYCPFTFQRQKIKVIHESQNTPHHPN